MIVNIRYGIVVRMRDPGGREIRQFQGQRVQHFSAERQREVTKNDSEDTVWEIVEDGGEKKRGETREKAFNDSALSQTANSP